MPDYMYMLESRLSAEQRAAVLRVQELAAAEGANVYLAGGAVRDLISGMPIRDLDFAVEGHPSRLARELEKGGAKILEEDERLRHVELIFAGDVDGSIAATRDDFYVRPGTRPEIRWSTIMEDLRRRDFSLNAVAISLNSASRGLLLDPTNGLSDLERREVRGLSIHSFTNQPVRLLRVLRYCVRMGFKMESRTADWFALAFERGLQEAIPPEDVGREVRQLAREEKPVAILKSWEQRGLIFTIHPRLAHQHPDSDALNRLVRVRDDMMAAGYRPRLIAPVTLALLGRLKPREQSAALNRIGFRSVEIAAVLHLDAEGRKFAKVLAGRKTAAPRDAYQALDKAPLDLLAYILAEGLHSKAVSKIKNFFHKWRPLRLTLPAAASELESLGLARGQKFEKVLADFFQQLLLGKGRTPEDRTKLLRKLSGIKEPPKKKTKEESKKRLTAKSTEKSAKKAASGHPHAAAGLTPEMAPSSKAAAAASQKESPGGRAAAQPKTGAPAVKGKAAHDAARPAAKARPTGGGKSGRKR